MSFLKSFLKKQVNKTALIFILVVLVASFYRFSFENHPFWVDETSTADQALTLIKYNFNYPKINSYFIEANNFTTHFITAVSFIILGENEFSARLPSMFFGSLVAGLIYFFTKLKFNENTALVASSLYTLSYLQITWARQARGYVLQQLLLVLLLVYYHKFYKTKSISNFLILILVSILGFLTHITFILILGSLALHYLVTNYREFINLKKPKFLLPFLAIFILFFITVNKYTRVFSIVTSNISAVIQNGLANNLSYYHSFLWREQTLITFLSVLGILLLFFKKKKYKLTMLLTLPLFIYLFFFCFIFSPYVSRYLLPIFPILFILSGFAISEISEMISKKKSLFFSLFIAFFIIVNGDKFVLKPKAYYSVNHDMREAALIDYDEIYDLIQRKTDVSLGKTAIIDTWPDRVKWYLGKDHEYFYTFRWLNSAGLVNGLPKKTNFKIYESGEKYIPTSGEIPFKLIGELSDLEMAMAKYEQGFIIIDDESLPEDVRSYVESNFKKELYLDHYSLDDNPYSIWPTTLYSWGLE